MSSPRELPFSLQVLPSLEVSIHCISQHATILTAHHTPAAFSGVLAYALSHLGGKAGLESWRWIWLLEGAFTVLVGLLCPLFFVDNPERCGSWLTHEEKRYLVLRQRYGPGSAGVARSEAMTMSLIFDLFKSWQTWPQVLIYLSHSVLGEYTLEYFTCGHGSPVTCKKNYQVTLSTLHYQS